MERDTTNKKIVGTTSLEEALEQFAAQSEENRAVLDTSLKMKALMDQMVEERQYLGMTQRDFAEVTGIKQPMIARIEKLESIPRLDTFIRMVDKLDFEILLAYKVDFSPLNIGIKKIKYISVLPDEGKYQNNQTTCGRYVKYEPVANAA